MFVFYLRDGEKYCFVSVFSAPPHIINVRSNEQWSINSGGSYIQATITSTLCSVPILEVVIFSGLGMGPGGVSIVERSSLTPRVLYFD